MPYKDFVAGAVLTATEVDTYLMRQSVMTFATAAARDAALSGALTEGMVAYLSDSNAVTVYDGAAWVTMVGYAASTSWTPSYTNLTVGDGTVSAEYGYVTPKLILAKWRLVLGATSAVGTGPTLTLPVAPATAIEIDAKPVVLRDVTTSRFAGALYLVSGSQVSILAHSVSGTAIGLANVTATFPFTWTTSDVMSFSVLYAVA